MYTNGSSILAVTTLPPPLPAPDTAPGIFRLTFYSPPPQPSLLGTLDIDYIKINCFFLEEVQKNLFLYVRYLVARSKYYFLIAKPTEKFPLI